jgi:hypothetical protein
MRRTLTSLGCAALMCAVAWGITAEADAQAQELATESPASPEEAALPTGVPAYEPTAYELTPPGANGEGRSETRRWPNRPLMLTSTLVFTAAYVPVVLVTAFSQEDSTDNLYIPIAGPWLEIAREPVNPANTAALAISGVFQGLGALGMVTSLMVPERRTSRWYLLGNKRVAFAPVASRLAYGVSAAGRF